MDVLRLVDANFNRLGEGLRVLEDVARFVLDDAALTTELRNLRHGIEPQGPGAALLAARQAETDVGSTLVHPGEGPREDLVGLVRANARRAQEALRSLEEASKLPDVPSWLESERFKGARFALYEIEKKLVFSLDRQPKIARVKGLYVILDTQFIAIERAEAVARTVLNAGVRVLQLRDKLRPKGQLLPVARRLQEICSEHGAVFIVNDHIDLALAAGADGVHVGQKDLGIEVARRVLPPDKIVGLSTSTVDEALEARKKGADYIAVGSIFATTTKEDIRPAGLDMLRRVRAALPAGGGDSGSVPIIAIGGINRDNIAQVIGAGADGAAVISAVLGAGDIAAATRELVQAFEKRGG